MVQIEKKKKKGRPSKADLEARRAAIEDGVTSPAAAATAAEEEAEEREVRRSLRRKSFRYNIIDYDEDYLDDDVVSEGDERGVENGGDNNQNIIININSSSSKRRRGRKVKLVVKLNNGNFSVDSGGRVSRRGRVGDSEDEGEEEDERVIKKRRVNCGGDDDDEEEDENDEDEGRDEKEDVKGSDDDDEYGAGRNCDVNANTPLPDHKQLELILDKLQKKDTYGVYSEPVDPEELPDYHDVIEHPMDFSTMRKKLANGTYSTLEQFEADVFLISSNAMQYNSPDTVYYRQARAIKELAEKKFERVRKQVELLEKESKSEVMCEPKVELKSEQKERPYPPSKKQTKKPFSQGTQEPVGSDFSSGATLATMDAPIICSADHFGNFERSINNDGPLEGVSSLPDNILEKVEEPQLGKGLLPKFGRRTFVIDENRRATYNLSNQPEEKLESVFTTFDGDKKQLIPVGLSGELSFARSLARYAANLGPMAWRIASKMIEQVLPPGVKYGRGWIGEFEPVLNPVLVFEHVKDPFSLRLSSASDSRKKDKKDPVVTRSHDAVVSRKDEKLSECRAEANVHLFNQPSSDGKMAAIFGSGGAKPSTSTLFVSQQKNPPSRDVEDGIFMAAESNSSSISAQQHNFIFQQQNRFRRDTICPENMGPKRAESNSPSISDQKSDCFPQKQHSHGMEMDKMRVETKSLTTFDQKNENFLQKAPPHHLEIPPSMPNESLPKGKFFLQPPPNKQPDTNRGAPHGSSNGTIANNFVGSNRVNTSSQGFMSPHVAGAPVSFPLRWDQGLSDPVLVMQMMSEKAQRQQNGSIHAKSSAQVRPSVPSPRGDTGGNAAQATSNAWMSISSGGFRPPAQNSLAHNSPTSRSQISTDTLYNATTRMFYPQAIQSHVEYPGVPATMHSQPEKMGLPTQPKVGNEAQVPSRPMIFPHLVPNDLSRFQVQAPWRGHSPQTQQKQKPDTLPPDLNVAFQSSVDSQQPDLALQL